MSSVLPPAGLTVPLLLFFRCLGTGREGPLLDCFSVRTGVPPNNQKYFCRVYC